jgi:hypothetical protein
MGRRIFDRAAEGALLADGAFAPGAAAFAPGPANAVAAGKTAAGGLERGGAASAAPGDGEALRDAVAAPPSALAAAPAAFALRATPPSALGAFLRRLSGAAPASAGAPRGPASAPAFERLTLEFGAGLVVKVRSVLGLAPAVSPRPFSAGTRAPRPAAGSLAGAPLTSTEWLERRGLLESLSASEAAAGQAFAARGTAVPAAPVVSSPAPASAPSPARAPLRSDAAPSPALWLLAFLPAAVVLFKELR